MKFAAKTAKITKMIGIVFLPILSILSMTGCGSINLGQAVQITLDPATQSAKVEIELTTGLQVSLDGTYNLPNNYGDIYFVQPTQTSNGKIGVEISLPAIIGHDLGIRSMTTLPNGAALPVAITGPLFQIPVLQDSNFDVEAAVSFTPDLQLGAAVGIKVFSSTYVIPGIAVCQNFRNSSNEAFAALCIYGPSANGSGFGGIFIAADFGNVIPANLLNSSTPTIVGLQSRSAMFAMSTVEGASQLNLPIINLSSSLFGQVIQDPNKKMNTSAGQKSLNNVMQVLKVRK